LSGVVAALSATPQSVVAVLAVVPVPAAAAAVAQ